MRFITPALACLGILLAGPLLALAAAKPVPGEIMLVIGPDPSSYHAAIRRAGGRLVGPAQARFGLLVIAEDADFVEAVTASGAWLVVDGRPMALLCGVET